MEGREVYRLLARLLLLLSLATVNASKVLDEVPIPVDSELDLSHQRYPAGSDDEDFGWSAEGSTDIEEGSTTDIPNGEILTTPDKKTVSFTPLPVSVSLLDGAVHPAVVPFVAEMNSSPEPAEYVYYRVLVNFTNSIEYNPQLEDFESEAFREISEGIIDTLESEFYRISGEQSVTVVLIREVDHNVVVELDVGSDGNSNDAEIREVVSSAVRSGSIGPYETTVEGFLFRHLGQAVDPSIRPCHADEFTCGSGECIPLNFRCDFRADCNDMSDEDDCADLFSTVAAPPPPPTIQPTEAEAKATTIAFVTARPIGRKSEPLVTAAPTPAGAKALRPCPVDKAVCQNGQCIPRDYLCDGERDCTDGSDELDCGTPSPCEPNEFKCKNGRCALKLWRCDGDNDCGDGSDEEYCPTKGPGDMCAPEQFVCVSNRLCIPASYQCDEEADCPDRSDEFGCTPPQVVTPPEETVMVKRGATVVLNCMAAGVPTPIITWRLNWGHIPITSRVTTTSQNGRGTLVIRDVKESDQGAYTCEAINAKGMIFAIPDAILILKSNPGLCPEGQFNVEGTLRCIPCFCLGLTRNCVPTSRYRNQIRLRFTEEGNFMGVNVTVPAPAQPPLPPLTNSQMIVDTDSGEFQLVDLSRRFLNQESFWILPKQFLGNKVDSYGGYLRYKIRYSVPRGQVQPEGKLDVIITGNGRKLVYKVKRPAYSNVINQRDIIFTEDKWQHESGTSVTREDLMMTLANLDSILIQTKYDDRMASVGLSDIVMDTTSVEATNLGKPLVVEECRCPQSYVGLSCESCASGFNRVPNGQYLGMCDGCSCNGHASTCDKVTGYCLNCQHNTEGPQCDKCKPGFFGNPTEGTSGDCKPCPCPHTSSSRRFSDTCFVDTDKRPTCDACRKGYTGRRCETCAAGYTGDPMRPGGKCTATAGEITTCDTKGTDTTKPSDGHCVCKPNVVGRFCAECSAGFFNLDDANVDGCLKCFCMGNSKECASSSWHRDQVQGALDEQERSLYMLTNMADTRRFNKGIRISASNELIFTDFATVPRDIYYWILPERFKGDKVTSYGGKLQYTILQKSSLGSSAVTGLPAVILQGNNIFLEHYTRRPEHGVPTTITVHLKETEWRRADGQPSTRGHLLMALADINLFMIRGSYSEGATESRISQIRMDVAVPHSTGQEIAVEVEECVCPEGYKGTSCQECDFGYTRTRGGLYLGTCERCECNGHSDCDVDTGECQKCQHNTQGQKCEQCRLGFYGDAKGGTPDDCQPCSCPGTTPSNQFSETCFLGTDGKPTCNNCPSGFGGRNCERNLTEFCKAWIQPEILDSDELIPGDCQKIARGGAGVAGNGTKPGGQRHKGKPGTSSNSRNTTSDEEKFGNTSTPDEGTKLKNTTQKSKRTRNFRHLIKTSVIGFNRRLVMLEDNGLDLKDSFKHLQKRQDDLTLQLKNLSRMLSAPPKDRLVSQLQGKYTEVSNKLTHLQVRLEILIDGFAVLAEEMSELRKKKKFRTNSDQPNRTKITTSAPANPLTKHPKINLKNSLKVKPTSNGGDNGSLKFVPTKPPAKGPNATGQKKDKRFHFPKKPTTPIDPLPTLQTHVLTTASPKRPTDRIQANRKLVVPAGSRTKHKSLPGKKAPRADVSRVDPSFPFDLIPPAFTVTPDGMSTRATHSVLGKPKKSFPGPSREKVKIVNVHTGARTEAPARGKGGTNSSLKTHADSTGKTKPSRSLTKVEVKPGKKITAQPKDKAKRGSKTATLRLNTNAKPSGKMGGSQAHKIKHPGSDAASTHRKRKTFLRSDVTTLSPFTKQPKFAGKRPLPTSAPAKKVSGKRRTQLKIATEIPVTAQSLKISDVQPVAGTHGRQCDNDNTPRRRNAGGRKKKTKKVSALDILQLLKGGNHYTNANKKLNSVPLYITLGRLAIPIKIIPD